MASLDRNINLEEINVDSFLGIEYTKYQSTGQKIIFFGMMILGTVSFITLFAIFKVPMIFAMLLLVLFFAVGVLFGCNYNEHLSLFKYFILLLFNRPVKLKSRSREDIEVLLYHNRTLGLDKIKAETTQEEMSDDDVRKYLFMLFGGVALFFIVIAVLVLVFSGEKEVVPVHHEALLNSIRMNV